ncbi:ABC transporter permease [Desulfofalx alkaliphila]|uniref:ABC transporter permease n=1 Tax=Desulfofalx alkaliphila TaxID=105483 RepID=UPI0004E1C03E|nr:ABC transporter permease [Desulfofalx alkaliphila]
MNRYALKVLWRNIVVFKKTWLTSVTFYFVEPMLYLTAMGLGLGAFVGEINGTPYIQFIAPGIIATSAMWVAASESTYGSFVKMQYQKTYHAMVATPLNIEEVVAGEILYATFKAIVYGTIILLVITAFGLVASPWALLTPLVLVLAGLIFALLGMIWTGLVAKIDSFSFFFTLVITPMFLFSGIFFPLDSLPGIVQIAAWFLPLYHVVELLRSLAFGEVGLFLLAHVGVLLFTIVILYPFPKRLIKNKLGI